LKLSPIGKKFGIKQEEKFNQPNIHSKKAQAKLNDDEDLVVEVSPPAQESHQIDINIIDYDSNRRSPQLYGNNND